MNKFNIMTIKEACLYIMNELCDVPTSQTTIVRKIQQMTGYSYDSCRCNSFRNPNAIPEIWKLYKKIIINKRVHYIKGTSEYKQNYSKPNQYYELLNYLNVSDKIFTLSGTQSNCCKVLDNKKVIKVDRSPHTDGLKKDIYSIYEKGSYNLDFEGILSIKKINYINQLNADYILLTFRSSKRDILLKNINKNQISNFTYKGKNNAIMKCYLFSNLKSSNGLFSKR